MVFAAGKDRGAHIPGAPLNLPDLTAAGPGTFKYSVASGALVDFSLVGARNPNILYQPCQGVSTTVQ